MARTDANPPMPDFATDYVLQEVDPSYLTAGGEAEAVPAHRPGRVHPLRGLRRHLPVEVHPHGLGRAPSTKPSTPSSPATTRSDHVRVHRRRRRLHPVRAVRRPLPHRRDHPRQAHRPTWPRATPTPAPTDTATPTASGSEQRYRGDRFVANGNGSNGATATAAVKVGQRAREGRREGPRLAGVERRSSGPARCSARATPTAPVTAPT